MVVRFVNKVEWKPSDRYLLQHEKCFVTYLENLSRKIKKNIFYAHLRNDIFSFHFPMQMRFHMYGRTLIVLSLLLNKIFSILDEFFFVWIEGRTCERKPRWSTIPKGLGPLNGGLGELKSTPRKTEYGVFLTNFENISTVRCELCQKLWEVPRRLATWKIEDCEGFFFWHQGKPRKTS